jgi:hypothetical protein
MSESEDNLLFGPLTWNNFRTYMPQNIEQLRGAWLPTPKREALTCWYALLMDAVYAFTDKNKTTYPARLYAMPGTIDINAEWTNDIQTDLVQELFDHLYKHNKTSPVATGNQFVYIEGAARNIQHARNLVRTHLKRVLNERLKLTEFGRANDQLFDVLKAAPFVDTTPRTQQFRQKLIGIKDWESLSDHDEGVSIHDAVREFTLMKRNNPNLGVTTVDKAQRAPNWYKSEEYVRAVTRIITQVSKGPVTPDFLERALEKALRLLDSYRESREKKETIDDKFDENDPENHQSGADVRFEGTSKLYPFVEVELEEEVRILKATMLAVLTSRHPTRDIEILYGLSIGRRINDVADTLGINVKTVSRRRDEIHSSYLEWMKEYGDQAVGICLRQIFSEREFTEVRQ